jgi:outer membrane protein
MKRLCCTAAALATLALGSVARADDFEPQTKGTFVLDVRASDLSPESGDKISTAAGVDTGLKVHINDSVMPTLGFTYFLTNHLAVEAILGSTNHDIYARGGSTDVKVKSTWVLPPVVTLQYHFRPTERISPYVGAGVNATIFYAGSNQNGFRVHLNDNVGPALQAGADLAIKGHWAMNIDVKKVFVDTKANIDGGALKADVGLDPWVFSVGVGRRF